MRVDRVCLICGFSTPAVEIGDEWVGEAEVETFLVEVMDDHFDREHPGQDPRSEFDGDRRRNRRSLPETRREADR